MKKKKSYDQNQVAKKYHVKFAQLNGYYCESDLKLTESEIENICNLIEKELTFTISSDNILVINMKYVQSVIFEPID